MKLATATTTTLVLGGLLLAGCGDSPVTATPQRLMMTVSPNPLTAPADAGTDVLWNLHLSAAGSGSILIERGDVQLFDASGAKVGHTMEIWSRSTGCTVCSTDVRIADGRSESHSGRRIRYVGGGVPVRFVYTLSYVDDLGPGSTTVEVPVR